LICKLSSNLKSAVPEVITVSEIICPLNISRSKVKMEQEVKEESKTLDKTSKVEDDILKFMM
jgi:hypothetical protein